MYGVNMEDSCCESTHDDSMLYIGPEKLSQLTRLNDIKKFFAPISKQDRKIIVDTKVDGNTALFSACVHNKPAVVQFLLEKCDADTEIHCVYTVAQDSHSKHLVPPLWMTAISNRLDIAKILLDHGANVNGCSDSNSTAVRAACYGNHVEMVKCLVEYGADVNIPNKHGATCLMNAIESPQLCEFLIEQGADVNAKESDRELLTSLHFAVNYSNLESVKILLKHGADINAKSADDLTPLLLSALYNVSDIYAFLLQDNEYGISLSDKLDAQEILGAYYIVEDMEVEGIYVWQETMQERIRENIPKKLPPPLEIYGNVREPETPEELKNMIMNFQREDLFLQSLLVHRRILKPLCEHTIVAEIYYSLALQGAEKFSEAFTIVEHAHQGFMQKTDYFSENCILCLSYMLKTLIQLQKQDADRRTDVCRLPLALQTLETIVNHISYAVSSVKIDKLSSPEGKMFGEVLMMALDSLNITCEIFEKTGTAYSDRLRSLIRRLVLLNPKGIDSESLVHIVVNLKLKRLRFKREGSPWNRMTMMSLLVQCGANINAVDCHGDSPLHYHLRGMEVLEDDHDLLYSLLEKDAHIDMCNKDGITPLQVASVGDLAVCEVRYLTLQCLAASALCKYRIPYQSEIPSGLISFVKLHGQ